MADKDQAVSVEMRAGVLIISVGVSVLCAAIAGGTVFEDFPNGENAIITDEYAFARAVSGQLTNEEEDGSNPVHRMLDVAARLAIDAGADGILFPDAEAD